MDYFYVPREHIVRGNVEITGEEFNHLVHVMRRKEGDTIRVVDGKGTAYDVLLDNLKKRTASGTIISRHEHLHEPDVDLHLAVSILKNPSRFDFLVEKVVEIGVTKIIPLASERTIPKQAKVDRWQKLALAAMKQSGRSCLPTVEHLHSLSSVLASYPGHDCAYVCHEDQAVSKPLSQLLATSKGKNRSVLLLIGPEGGFSSDEIDACEKAGCAVASLGPRRLRTETAAVCAAALILQE